MYQLLYSYCDFSVYKVKGTNTTNQTLGKIVKTNSVQWTAMAQENNHGTSFAQKKRRTGHMATNQL